MILIGLVAVAALAVAAYFVFFAGDDADDPPVSDLPAGAAPGDLGDDARLDELADSCHAGDLQACDDLYLESPFGSAYESYGDSCGRRNDPSGYCVEIYAD